MRSAMQARVPEIEHEAGTIHLMILDDAEGDAASSSYLASLEAEGHHVIPVHSASEALQVLGRSRPQLLVVAVGSDALAATSTDEAALRALARDLGIPTLDLVEPGTDLRPGLGRGEEADDWVVRGAPASELVARVARLTRRRLAIPATPARARSSPIDMEFSSLVVHDMRTPLNVIGLSLRMIEQALPRNDPEVEEDLRFIDENFRQIERMLTQLSDYARLFEPGLALSVSEFDPRRLVGDLLENRDARSGGKGTPVSLEVEKSCPAEAELDQGRARMAIEYALINAGAAANHEPIRLKLRGGPERWIIEIAVDRPPPASVRSVALDPHGFERLCGSAAERRGLDLAISARISELFQGSARLEATASQGTNIVLDWPVRIPDPASNS